MVLENMRARRAARNSLYRAVRQSSTSIPAGATAVVSLSFYCMHGMFVLYLFCRFEIN